MNKLTIITTMLTVLSCGLAIEATESIETGQSYGITKVLGANLNGVDYIYLACVRGTIVRIDKKTNEVVKGNIHVSTAESLALDEKSQLGISGSFNGNLAVWGMSNLKLLRKIKIADDPIVSLQINAEGSQLIAGVGLMSGEIKVLDLKSLQMKREYKLSDAQVRSVAACDDMILAATDRGLRLWKKNGEFSSQVGHEKLSESLRFVFWQDEAKCDEAFALSDRSLYRIDPGKGFKQSIQFEQYREVSGFAYNGENRALIVARFDGSISLFCGLTEMRKKLGREDWPVNGVYFMDNNSVAYGGTKGILKLSKINCRE